MNEGGARELRASKHPEFLCWRVPRGGTSQRRTRIVFESACIGGCCGVGELRANGGHFFLKWSVLERARFKERRTPGERLLNSSPVFKGDSKMDKRDWELLDKQLCGVSRSPPQNGAIIGLTIVAVFLAGIGIGDILSKSKQANTNYAAVISRIAGASP
jgi:hypothetical protein